MMCLCVTLLQREHADVRGETADPPAGAGKYARSVRPSQSRSASSPARSSLPDVTHERGGEQTPQSETGESLLLCAVAQPRH